MRRDGDLRLAGRLLRHARPYWVHIVAVILLDLLAAPIALLNPVPLKIAVDSVIGSHAVPKPLGRILPAAAGSGTGLLIFAALLVVAIALVSQIQKLSSSVLRAYAGERLILDLRGRLFQHAQRLSLTYHDTAGTADTIYRIQNDAPAVRTVAIDGLAPVITAVFTLVGMIYVTARIDWQLALVALAISPAMAMLTAVYRARLRGRWREVKELESSGLSVVQEALTALRVVKAFGQEEREHRRFVQRYRAGVMARLRALVSEGGYGLLVGLTTAAGTAAVLLLGVWHVLQGVLTLGSLLLVVSYLGQLYGPLYTLQRKVTDLQKTMAGAERVFSFLMERPDVVQRPDARPLTGTTGRVSFRNVSFGYEPRQRVLQDLTFDVPGGARVGIMGRTGAGKTTLASLLPRFFDPTEGEILLDGTDIRSYRVKDLRNQFAIVLQDTVLFSTRIAENIAYARPDAGLEEIERAARVARIHEFIAGLPDGYDTLVGERGMRLSGGERQRVALARAFLKDAPILILDEPTSSVDLETEAAIMAALEELTRGRTTFLIAHRLNTLRSCDLLLVLEDGRLVTSTADVEEALGSALRAGSSGGAAVTGSAGAFEASRTSLTRRA